MDFHLNELPRIDLNMTLEGRDGTLSRWVEWREVATSREQQSTLIQTQLIIYDDNNVTLDKNYWTQGEVVALNLTELSLDL